MRGESVLLYTLAAFENLRETLQQAPEDLGSGVG